jgi:SAM-dependent methyltransferase
MEGVKIMKEKVLETYDKLAKDYEMHVDTQSGHNVYYERPAMMKLMPSDMNQLVVLDAGCAAGWYSEQFIKLGAQVTAVDLSPAMVEACKRRVGNKAEVFTCDLAEPLPFKNETFNLIVSSLTLHYIDDWVSTFREFHRVMKPGGHLIFSVHHPFMDFKHFDRPDYFAHELLMEIWNKKESGPVEVKFFRRPLHEILNVTTEQFIMDRIVEPQPIIDFKDNSESLDWYNRWFDRLTTNPHFLIVTARKKISSL